MPSRSNSHRLAGNLPPMQRRSQTSARLAEAAAITLGGPGLAYHSSRRRNARRLRLERVGTYAIVKLHRRGAKFARHDHFFTEAQSLAMNARASVTSARLVVEPCVSSMTLA